ncbi:hypothetical protein NMY3_00766 [Candidatus Nitrosocosmicus oleophilus]|jgi:hypothetical protein|uniref:Uncharacterized protein n=1 Tax=Candidatus Nitrosocosmicus oleophilus TaxID=1353260 RepID=A0A654LUV3_9ARCH|nr:hypothetical protein NMY3_00766 [Candidatus Nitrosocosmicus oleophilus]
MTVLDLLIFAIFGVEIEFVLEFITSSRPIDFPNLSNILNFIIIIG